MSLIHFLRFPLTHLLKCKAVGMTTHSQAWLVSGTALHLTFRASGCGVLVLPLSPSAKGGIPFYHLVNLSESFGLSFTFNIVSNQISMTMLQQTWMCFSHQHQEVYVTVGQDWLLREQTARCLSEGTINELMCLTWSHCCCIIQSLHS